MDNINIEPVIKIRCCKVCNEVKELLKDFSSNRNGNQESRRHTCVVCEKIKIKERNKLQYQKNKDILIAKAKNKYLDKKLKNII